MYKVDIYLRIRQACLVDGKSRRQVSKEFGVNRRTITKILKHSIPPGYQRQKVILKPKLKDHKTFINEILEDDKGVHPKQRHTARRIFRRLKEERGYEGGYTTIRVYVAERRKKTKEMFVPLSHEPGNAQVDFGESYAIIGGIKQKVHLYVMDLPFSDSCFVKAYQRENTESFCDGHVSAFDFFGGVPLSILYDNTKIAVSRILGGVERKKTKAFMELQSHYLFKDIFARVGKGNDKGKVENLVGYARRNFMVPLPEFKSIEALNEHLKKCCLKRQEDILRGQQTSISERLKQDEQAFLKIPPTPYEACTLASAIVSSQSLVRFKANDYSVPVRYGYKRVFVKGYVDKVVIVYEAEEIAHHKRCYGKGEAVFEPLHYLPLLERKVGALDQAAPLKDWSLPSVFTTLKGILEHREGKRGKREYVKILRLLEAYGLDEVTKGIEEALSLGIFSQDGIKHLILAQIEGRPPSLNLLDFPNVPNACVEKTCAETYESLMRARS